MVNITIGTITMPRTRSLEVGGELVATEATMASGRIVRDIIGWRKVLTAEWDWIPAETLAALVPLARSGAFVPVAYPDADGTAASGNFKIEIGSQRVFAFRDGAPMWRNVALTATAQEVTDYAAG